MYGSMNASLSGDMQINYDNLSVHRNDCVYVCDHAWIDERDEIAVDIYIVCISLRIDR